MKFQLTPYSDHHLGSQAQGNCRCVKRLCQEQCQFINIISKCMPNICSYHEIRKCGIFYFI